MPLPPGRFVADEPGPAQDLQVLCHGGPAEVEPAGEVPGGEGAVHRDFRQAPSHGVGEGDTSFS